MLLPSARVLPSYDLVPSLKLGFCPQLKITILPAAKILRFCPHFKIKKWFCPQLKILFYLHFKITILPPLKIASLPSVFFLWQNHG
ncbi:hypothetical protein HanIR_Chr07g0341931 [Helianthus annuus]|nr:hypothetical protein HanIR_Chr07g0341931 [Helianthus annuus]